MNYKIDLSKLDKEGERKEISARIQKACFAHGVGWFVLYTQQPMHENQPYLWIGDSELSFGESGDKSYFSNDSIPEIHYADFLMKYEESPVDLLGANIADTINFRCTIVHIDDSTPKVKEDTAIPEDVKPAFNFVIADIPRNGRS